MRVEKWPELNDDLDLFPDYNKKEDIEKVKAKLLLFRQKFQTKPEHLVEEFDRMVGKLNRMTDVLSGTEINDVKDKNKSLILENLSWLGHDFIFHAKKDFKNNDLIFFESIHDDDGYGLLVHPFENQLNEMPSGGITGECLEIFLSKQTPVILYRDSHYFMAAIEGIRKQ
jgi:hypothetical protein